MFRVTFTQQPLFIFNMPLINIPYQPLAFNPVRPTDCFAMCDGRNEYCMPFQPEDPIYAQFTQTPCGQSIACDGDFSAIDEGAEVIPDGNFNALGIQELTNGTFTGSEAPWILQTDWSYGTNNIVKVSGVSGTAATQVLSNTTPVNAIYKVVFTVSGSTAGNLTPQFSGGGPTDSGTATTTNATFTQYIKVGSAQTNFTLLGSALFDGTIDNVSVKRIASTWEFFLNTVDGWTINSNGFAATIGTTGEPLVCPGVVNPNTDYELIVVFEAGSSGNVSFYVGGQLSTIHVIAGAVTITENITSGAGTDFSVAPTFSSFTGIISSISLTEISGECWDFDTDLWTVTNESLCKTPGTADLLTNAADLLAGTYYQVKISVQGRTEGAIQPSVNFVSGDAIDDDGTFISYYTPLINSQLVIFANSLFDGCITSVEIFALRNDFLFELRDGSGTTVADLSSNPFGQKTVFYHEDYVTLKFKFSELLDIADRPIPYDCYRVYAYDFCELQYEEIIRDGDFTESPVLGVYWVSDGDPFGTITITAGQIVFDLPTDNGTGLDIINAPVGYNPMDLSNLQNPKIPFGSHNYRIEFDIIENNDPVNNVMQVYLGGSSAYAEPSTVGHHSITLNNVSPLAGGGQQVVRIICNFLINQAGHVVADNFSAHRIEPFDVTFVSQCIKYAANFPCTKYIIGSCYENAMGFKFVDDLTLPQGSQTQIFLLAHRVEIEAGNDSFPEATDDYLFSNGTRMRNFSQSENSITIKTGNISLYAHATIRLQRACQFFAIGEPPLSTAGNFIYYFCMPGDYNPEWNKSMKFKLASARFEVQLRDEDVKFFRNV